mmetsp:Transcript_6362/g.16267  ORF Transcript_6362/g.16267 Transcript_6362/m.16267 type:complete len:220 (-) Transcript_6362:323-982(-)
MDGRPGHTGARNRGGRRRDGRESGPVRVFVHHEFPSAARRRSALASSPRYCLPLAHLLSSLARKIGRGCVSRSVCEREITPPILPRALSSNRCTCFRKASVESSAPNAALPPVSLRMTDRTTAGSCATSSAARSHVSSAERRQESSAASIAAPSRLSITSAPTASALATVIHRPCSHTRWPHSWARTAWISAGESRSSREVCTTMKGLLPSMARVYALG